MSFFQIINPWSALKNSAPRLAGIVGLLITSVLMGCGGGGSSSGSSSGSSDSGSNTPTSQVNLGVYTTSISNLSGNKDLTLIINSHSASSTNGLFYALQFNSSAFQVQQPDIFSGSIAGIGNTTASISSLTEFSTDLNTLKSGAASFSFPTQDKLKVVVSESGNAVDWSDATSITLDTTSSLAGIWTGNLYYPTGGVTPNLSITFTSSPTSSDPDNLSFSVPQFGNICLTSSGNATPSPGGANLYNFNMNLTNNTGCVLRDISGDPGTFTGVAFVTASPVAGRTKRLQWVAITSQGRGLSFRADR
jgi:hypothetical protein